MKKQLILSLTVITICVLSIAPSARAQTATPKPTISPTTSETLNEKLNSQINQLKDKIASRVTELNLVEKKGITGTVVENTTSKITINDLAGNPRIIDIDEITKFASSSSRGTFGLSDLTKGTKINVLGLYNKQSKRILARFINTAVNPVFLTGAVSEIDSKNFILTLTTPDKKQIKIDVGTTTKLSSYSPPATLTKIGFTKIEIGDRVSVIGLPDKTDSSLIISQRIVVLDTLPADPSISIAVPSPTPTKTPTTIIKPSTAVKPSITIKPSPTIAR